MSREDGKSRPKWASTVRRAWPWALVVLIAYVVLGEFAGSGPIAAGAQVLPFEARLADGTSFSFADHRGRVLVLCFWASWCPVCVEEVPVVSRAYQRLQAEGGTLLGITVEQGPLATVEQRARQLGIDYPIARVSDATLRGFGVSRLPTTVVVGTDGRVVDSFVGYVSDEDLGQAIDQAQDPRSAI